ncbi:DUF6327 family protein [Aequorivita vladivostokensis]|jgi:hypothetical protein|uniref:Glutaminyl-tRNA synthetase n=1 Tax=Aequorivita vladivostokensis TaxID=171194 RepID=A0ABR5DJ40_9FLAO|nr:DUF6327 family protein [Aequorivita vladivostokensis]MAB40448.1 hypothetical protein [Aequorivita sp.]KJJ38798.1 glutaminyl-tRNA synthetase [Aequorivita vladivostokensis]MAB58702.1 hypothetical protein [Aequorivita sp.]MBF30034.1 hypothetical protein [Aequorivita sp.]HAV55762.1 hypothetical protein [Aequorivita sp.]|tara:strand:- start:1447 stop:1698 length:252 start_codon:yes stop_codon:yes gene_type:complete
MKRYTTFEEIDRDLKYLRLKSQIDLEEVKLGLNQSKETLNETFSPINIIASTVGSILKKAFVLKVVDKLIGIKPVKKKDYEDD